MSEQMYIVPRTMKELLAVRKTDETKAKPANRISLALSRFKAYSFCWRIALWILSFLSLCLKCNTLSLSLSNFDRLYIDNIPLLDIFIKCGYLVLW